jgi:hypothetical protein
MNLKQKATMVMMLRLMNQSGQRRLKQHDALEIILFWMDYFLPFICPSID